MNRYIAPIIAASWILIFTGCQKDRDWEIAAENQSDTPCTFIVDLGNNSYSRVDNMANGGPTVLQVGSAQGRVFSVKVVRGASEQEIKSEVRLIPGKRFLIRVSPDGKAAASLSDR